MSKTAALKEANALTPVWESMLSASLKQTLILSYLNRKFPGAIEEMAHEFGILSGMLSIPPDAGEEVKKTLEGMPKTNRENEPFRILSNEIMADAIIQTLLLRYLIKSDPEMAQAMLADFQTIAGSLELNETIITRVTASLSEFLPSASA